MKCSPNRAALRKEPHSCSKSLVWVKQVDNELELIHIYNYVFIFLCGICRWLVSSIGATSSASTGSTSKSEFATVNMHNANWTSIIWGQWQWETDDMTIKSKVALWAKANQPPVPVERKISWYTHCWAWVLSNVKWFPQSGDWEETDNIPCLN